MSKVTDKRKPSSTRSNPAQWKPGQSGNSLGRPKGPGRMLMDSFVRDFFGAWSRRGEQAIEDVITNYPDVALYSAAALVPKDIKTKSKPLIDDNARLAARMLEAGSDVRGASAAASPDVETRTTDGQPAGTPHANTAPDESPHPIRLRAESATPDRPPHQGEVGLREPYAKALAQRESETNRLALYRPYPPQREFHEAGAIHDERLLMAGNQLGKTLCGAMEWAMHLTGAIPSGGRARCSTIRCECGRRA